MPATEGAGGSTDGPGGDRVAPGHRPRTEPTPPSGEPPGRRLGGWPVRLGQLLLTGIVTWLILRGIGVGLDDLQGVDPARWVPRWGLFALSSAVLFGGYLMSAGIWGRMVRDLGGPRLRLATAVRIFMIANLGRYIPGKLWQIAGLALLGRQKGVPPAIATAAAVLGQGIALAAAALVGLTVLLGAGPGPRLLGMWLLGGAALGLAIASFPPVLARIEGLWLRLAGADAPTAVAAGPGMVFRWFILYVLNWGVYAISFWILVESFGLPGGPARTGPAFAAAYVVGYLAFFAPAGIGVREGVLAGFLAPVTGPGPAGVLAVVARIWATVVEVVPAVAMWLRHLALARRGGTQ